MKIKAIIIDDESLARKLVKNYLKDYPEIEIVDECSNGFEAAKSIGINAPNLIFLDVQMPKIDGFELLELLDEKPHVIFTTAFDEFALRAFESSATDYLLKPFDRERFSQAINKFKIAFNSNAKNNETDKLLQHRTELAVSIERVAVKEGHEIKIIPTKNIKYFEAFDDYVKIFTDKKMYLKKQTMSYYENNLSKEDFIRIHRSFILNVSYLSKIEQAEKDSHWVILKDMQRLNVSRSGYQKLKSVLGL
jgi:two-component system LytT family response regulator